MPTSAASPQLGTELPPMLATAKVHQLKCSADHKCGSEIAHDDAGRNRDHDGKPGHEDEPLLVNDHPASEQDDQDSL